MQFTYSNEIPTIESAIQQGMGFASACWTNLTEAGEFQSDLCVAAAAATINEVRSIIASELLVLMDKEGVAQDWNDAIEAAIQLVEAKPVQL